MLGDTSFHGVMMTPLPAQAPQPQPPRKTEVKFLHCVRTVWVLRAHCVHTAHAEAGILTQVIRLVVTVLFPRKPFQKNEQSKNI